MAIDFSVGFCGIQFKNPFLMASAPAADPPGFKKAARAGWAGGILWAGTTLAPVRGIPRGWISRETKYIEKPPAFFALQNISSVEGLGKDFDFSPPATFAKTIKEAKESGLPVGVNVVGSYDPSTWIKGAIAAEKAGADLLELNFSCPYLPGIGFYIGKDPDKVREITAAIKKAVSIPVMPKLSAHLLTDDLVELAKSLESIGADAISVTNALLGFIGVDIETGLPISTFIDHEGRPRSQATGISGPAIKPFVLRAVADLAKAVKIPICGIGGVNDWQSAVEFLMLGASLVQVSTGLMVYGYRMVKDMLKGLEAFMERKGYNSIKDFQGLTTKKYLADDYIPAPVKQPHSMVIDEAKCTGCGRCVPACEANATSAIRVDELIARIDQSICIQCNMCRLVCPSEAISVIGLPIS